MVATHNEYVWSGAVEYYEREMNILGMGMGDVSNR